MSGATTPATPARARMALCMLLAAAGNPAHAARMYQWVDPQTGTVQLAGQPPPWLTRGEPGPRVRVFEHGRVIDDTAYAPRPPATPSAAAAPGTVTPPAPDQDIASRNPVPAPADRSRARVEEFKALLEAWDREQAARASQAHPAPAAPSAVPAPPPH